MVQVSYPGVYIQEVSSGVRTITGVSTSIAAFMGRATKGRIDVATRLLSYADFERSFGEPHPRSDLAQSVKMFFTNGGTDCYVVRLAPGALPASVRLQDLRGNETLVATAKAAGLWGNTIRMSVDYSTANPHESFNLSIFHEDAGVVVQEEKFSALSMDPNSARFAPSFVTQSSQLIDLAIEENGAGPAAPLGDPMDSTSGYNDLALSNSFAGYSNSRRPLNNGLGNTDPADIGAALDGLIGGGQFNFDISVNDGPYVTVDLSTEGPYNVATVTNLIQSAIDTSLASLSPVPAVTVSLSAIITDTVTDFGRTLIITSNSGTMASVRVRRSAQNDIAAALMLGVDQGGIEAPQWSNFRPAPNASIVRIGDPATPGDLSTADNLLVISQNAVFNLDIDGEIITVNLATTAAGDPWYQNTATQSVVTGDSDGVREKLRIIANAINAVTDPEFNFKAEVWGYQLAILARSGPLSRVPSVLSSGVALFDNGVNITSYRSSLGQDVLNSKSSNSVPGGDGGIPNQGAYLGNEENQTGIHALDPVDLFNLLILPGDEEVDDATMATIWGPASVYCRSRRAFLLVDSPHEWTSNNGRPQVVQDTSLINNLRSSMVKDHAAVFYPRLKYINKGLVKTIGASGAIAGLMARTDSTRGVWKAPAGIEAGLHGITDVNLKLTDAENGVLNKKGVNCIRSFPSGLVNWGGRTLDGDDDLGSEWKYIPIRRLALMIEESLFRGTQWVVFEPNDEPLWANIRLNLGAFMNSLFRQGAFQGASPQEAYYVKCNSETTTQNDRNLGIVNIEVGFAPLKPAEFVVIKIQQIAGDIPT